MEACLTKCCHSNGLLTAVNSLRRSSMSIHSVRNSVKKAYDGLLLDAAGTLLQLPKPVEETYASIGAKYGLKVNSAEIKQGFKRAFAAPWPEKLRYEVYVRHGYVQLFPRFSCIWRVFGGSYSHTHVQICVGHGYFKKNEESEQHRSKQYALRGDGKPFWKLVVSEATGCSSDDYFEEVYEHYANGDAWRLPDGASETIFLLKNAGGHTSIKVAVVSNFDARLRNVLKELNVIDLFDAIIISSEVGHEKPDARIFKAALDQIDVEAGKVVHVGDDLKADKVGANAVGIDCWLWGKDVKTFADIQKCILI